MKFTKEAIVVVPVQEFVRLPGETAPADEEQREIEMNPGTRKALPLSQEKPLEMRENKMIARETLLPEGDC